MATDEKNRKISFIVGGYEFMSEEDAKKAELDLSKIKLLEARVKASRPNDIKAVYEKSIENKIFKTPIGWGYLCGLREKLLQSGFIEEDLVPIPLNISMTRHSALENLNVRQRIKVEEPKRNIEFRKVFPIVLDVVLAILVILMFVVAATGENDNILNYKRNVTNRYASWEEDLKEREKRVRQAEKRLGIEDTSDYYEENASDG
ncbi:MAG: hypothetical protein IJ695_10265 [Butyrivibrio sp.]|nr:hypothetical protein [Butyrivibrio sp.]